LPLSTEVTLFSTWKTTLKKQYVICFPVGAFNVLEVSVEYFILFKAKFDAGSQFFKSAIFLGLPELQVEQHLTRCYSTVTHITTLFQAGNDLADSPLSTPSSRSL